jgi:hypothetical protein
VTAGAASQKVVKIKLRPCGSDWLVHVKAIEYSKKLPVLPKKGNKVTGRAALASHVVATTVLLNGLFTIWIWALPEAAVIQQLPQGHLVAPRSVSVILLAGSSFVPLTPSHTFAAV